MCSSCQDGKEHLLPHHFQLQRHVARTPQHHRLQGSQTPCYKHLYLTAWWAQHLLFVLRLPSSVSALRSLWEITYALYYQHHSTHCSSPSTITAPEINGVIIRWSTVSVPASSSWRCCGVFLFHSSAFRETENGLGLSGKGRTQGKAGEMCFLQAWSEVLGECYICTRGSNWS